MDRGNPPARIPAPVRFFHEHLFPLLLGSYALAAVWPGPGLRLRGLHLGSARLGSQSMHVTPPALMLGLLLLNAGLGVRLAELKGLARRPTPLIAGLLANMLIPIAFITLIAGAMNAWHHAHETQVLLVGLALVASMPIAGSSAAWAQNAEGDLALSLGLVIASTLLSPIATPLVLGAVSGMTEGDYSSSLRGLAAHGSELFLVVCVIVPTALGVGLRALLGERISAAMRPWLKAINAVNLLVLCYSNAAAALPQAVAHPDWDFLAVILGATSSLCALGFGVGWGLGRLLGVGMPASISLMFGLGMSNNGTGLVLASIALANHPRVMLPVLAYNLIQQVIAAAVGAWRARERPVAVATA